jgi:phosphoribosylglycinamide formyltransferase 1
MPASAELVVSFEPGLGGPGRLDAPAHHGLPRSFPGRVVNLHPAFPGELPGTRAIERAFEQHQAGRRTHTGVMVHLVPDEGVDDGPVLASTQVPIRPDDTFDTLAERVHAAEHHLLVETLRTLCTRTTEETLR